MNVSTKIAPYSLVLVASIWGSSYPVVKDIMVETTVLTYLVARFLLTLPILLFIFYQPIKNWVVQQKKQDKALRIRTSFLYVFPGIMLAAAFMFQTTGIKGTSPATAAFLTALSFCFIPIFEQFHRERQNIKYIVLPLILAFIGVLLFSQVDRVDFTYGELLLLLCAIFYAGQIFYTGRLNQHKHPAVPFFIQGITVVIILIVFWFFSNSRVGELLDILFSWKLLYIVLAATLFCFLVQFWAQKYIRSRYVALIYTVEPLSAFYFSNLLGYDKYSVNNIVGSVLIIFAVSITIFYSQRDIKEEHDGG